MPIGDSRTLNLEVMTYGQKIDNLSYKIRSMDSERLLVEEESAQIVSTQDKVTCQVKLPSLFEDNIEYNMEIAVTMGDEIVYCYTRIVHAPNSYTDETLAFALQFHEYTFREDASTFIPTYMDPATGDATNLAYVDLSCTLGQITWADFGGVKLIEPVVSFKEVNPSYNVITLNYVMTNVNENNEVEYYNVEEYYRLRQTNTRIYVLNFERRMNKSRLPSYLLFILCSFFFQPKAHNKTASPGRRYRFVCLYVSPRESRSSDLQWPRHPEA